MQQVIPCPSTLQWFIREIYFYKNVICAEYRENVIALSDQTLWDYILCAASQSIGTLISVGVPFLQFLVLCRPTVSELWLLLLK